MKGTPSFCIQGIKISEHLGLQLKNLGIDYGKDEAEMDIIAVSCDGDKINIILGECKVSDIFWVASFVLSIYILKIYLVTEPNGWTGLEISYTTLQYSIDEKKMFQVPLQTSRISAAFKEVKESYENKI